MKAMTYGAAVLGVVALAMGAYVKFGLADSGKDDKVKVAAVECKYDKKTQKEQTAMDADVRKTYNATVKAALAACAKADTGTDQAAKDNAAKADKSKLFQMITWALAAFGIILGGLVMYRESDKIAIVGIAGSVIGVVLTFL
jgi:hypothetical protein